MQRDILIFVVFLSFLGVVLAQEKYLKLQVIENDEQEEHPGSVYLTSVYFLPFFRCQIIPNSFPLRNGFFMFSSKNDFENLSPFLLFGEYFSYFKNWGVMFFQNNGLIERTYLINKLQNLKIKSILEAKSYLSINSVKSQNYAYEI